jgi:hypothetical protein
VFVVCGVCGNDYDSDITIHFESFDEAHTALAESGEWTITPDGYLCNVCKERRLVRDFQGFRPAIVVLCGSTRFHETFAVQNLRLTLAGKIVLSIGCDTKSDGDLFGVEDIEGAKARLDVLHLRKIDLADEVLVLNVGGYVGDSTRAEIAYAQRHGKPVRFLEPAAVEDGVRPMATDELQFMSQEEYRASGLDKCPHTHRTVKSGLEVCDACHFIVTESLVF